MSEDTRPFDLVRAVARHATYSHGIAAIAMGACLLPFDRLVAVPLLVTGVGMVAAKLGNAWIAEGSHAIQQ